MKNKFVSVCLSMVLTTASILWALPAHAAEPALSELDDRIWNATQVLNEIMLSPDQSIPEELLAKCKAIAIYPDVLKGAFIFGGRIGKGIVLTRDETGKWSPVAFSTIVGGSWGFQIGGSATDLILLVMNERGVESLLRNNVTLGVDVQAAAGPVGRDSQVSTDLFLKAGIFTYSKSRGLFAGMALDGAVLTQDDKSNAGYYGQDVGSKGILLKKEVQVQPSSQGLIDRLTEYSARWDKRVAGKKK